jgi:parvulin-like peptidyl-prolyl isomerase
VSSSHRFIFASTAVLISLLAVSCKDGSSSANGDVAARVGSREVTMKQVDSVIKQQVDAGGGAAFSPAELVAARLSVLDNLIQEEALFQKAQKENVVPDDNKVTQEIQKKKQEAGLTEEQYQNQLKDANMTEAEYREKIQRQLAITALRDAQSTRVNPPTEEEIRKYFDENKDRFRAERGADISIIVTDPGNNGAADDAIGEAQAEQKIKQIYETLKGGADFTTIASQRSEDQQSVLRGGNLGFGSEAELKQSFPTRPEIPARLMSMSAGQYTEPIKDNLSSRWYIFKVNSKREQAQNLTFEDVRKNIVDALTQQRQQLLLNALISVSRSEVAIKNYLAERIVQNPKTIVEMRPTQMLQDAAKQQPQPTPRIENENQAAAPSSTVRPGAASSSASSNTNKNAK